MDNIVVKSSGNTIKLQSSPEEVTGGYFDSEEVWHDFYSSGSEFVSVTISMTETSAEDDIQLLNVFVEAPEHGIPEGFQAVGGVLIHPGESLNIKVLKNAFVTNLYEEETGWLKLVRGTGKTYGTAESGHLYFDEDGQTAVLDYFYQD